MINVYSHRKLTGKLTGKGESTHREADCDMETKHLVSKQRPRKFWIAFLQASLRFSLCSIRFPSRGLIKHLFSETSATVQSQPSFSASLFRASDFSMQIISVCNFKQIELCTDS